MKDEEAIALAILQALENAPMKVKFITAIYDPLVDNFLDEEVDKFIYGDLAVVRRITGTPSLFISSNKDVLIAFPYKQVELDDKSVLDRINGMDEKTLQSFSNWEDVIKDLQKKGYTIGIG